MSIRPARLLFVLVGLGLLNDCGRSDTPAALADNSQLPAPDPARPAVIATPIEKQLANGLRVVVLPRAGSALMAAEFLLLSGSEVDPADRAGLADFTASLLNQGTKSPAGSRSASQLAAAAEALGGPLQAQAGWDATTIGITVTTPKLAAALDLLADVVRHPAFARDEVERYRAQAIDSLRLSFSDPADLAPLVAARIVHGNAPYGHPRLGTPASVQRITAAELRALHRRYYRPDRAVLVPPGDSNRIPDSRSPPRCSAIGTHPPKPRQNPCRRPQLRCRQQRSPSSISLTPVRLRSLPCCRCQDVRPRTITQAWSPAMCSAAAIHRG